MYFRNYRLRNRWLDKFLKSPVTKNNLTVSMSLITVKVIELERVSLSGIKKHKNVC